ncbi:hypothetical protein EXIGLDRAFT_55423 [Exidia glandulosa HHB12029]|uniref:Uncharacterized protein n=1 Tax=Exidia glandulosa HHB12029 TaxID=1314781 RepID=A0A166MNT5_EXIGL|nr:hypothetical protein EXIGLDRAFT_55423 [Exidia glandulosa HHB12029]
MSSGTVRRVVSPARTLHRRRCTSSMLRCPRIRCQSFQVRTLHNGSAREDVAVAVNKFTIVALSAEGVTAVRESREGDEIVRCIRDCACAVYANRRVR